MIINEKESLAASIWKTVGLYSAGECLVFFIAALVYSFSFLYFCLFFAVQTVFHLMIIWYLLGHRDFFFMVETKTPLKVINMANKITLFRITMAPLLLFLILRASRDQVLPVLIPLLILTFLSDLADGHVSRVNHEQTFIGRILDSSGDYLVVGLLAVFYYFLNFIPNWLFILILLRLIFNPLGVLILFKKYQRLEPNTTMGGKITIAFLMILFVPELLRLRFPGLRALCFYGEIIAAIILGLSLVDKGIYFVKNFTAPREEPHTRAGRKGPPR
jgi:CDP-diacylglycerol--glycerol-3-phosphate 3-phosphatidyltransferase